MKTNRLSTLSITFIGILCVAIAVLLFLYISKSNQLSTSENNLASANNQITTLKSSMSSSVNAATLDEQQKMYTMASDGLLTIKTDLVTADNALFEAQSEVSTADKTTMQNELITVQNDLYTADNDITSTLSGLALK
jgi:type II secretory pathway pseudopilin PulG